MGRRVAGFVVTLVTEADVSHSHLRSAIMSYEPTLASLGALVAEVEAALHLVDAPPERLAQAWDAWTTLEQAYAVATDRCANPADDEYAHLIEASRNALIAFAESLRSHVRLLPR
jgi:hypothetical protein